MLKGLAFISVKPKALMIFIYLILHVFFSSACLWTLSSWIIQWFQNCALTFPSSNSTGLLALTKARQAHTFAEMRILSPSPFLKTQKAKSKHTGETVSQKRDQCSLAIAEEWLSALSGATLNFLKIKSNKANIQVLGLPRGKGFSGYNLCGKVVPWPFFFGTLCLLQHREVKSALVVSTKDEA